MHAIDLSGACIRKSEALKNVEQDITVQGKVIDENGEAVIGASILVIRTNGGTITDLDGNFRLSARTGDELRVSYVGYETQQLRVTSSNMTIQLQLSSETLDEVVVVGYGTQRVKDLTGAATNVNLNEIAELPGTSIIDATGRTSNRDSLSRKVADGPVQQVHSGYGNP